MEMPAEIVDAHHHLWDLSALRYPWLTDRVDPDFMYGDYAGLRRDYGVADYRADADGLPVVATIHCEAEADRADPVAETRWLAARAAADGLPGALVAWVDLAAPDRERVLDAHLAASDRVRGVRCKPALPDEPGAPDPPNGGFSDPAWLVGLDTIRRRGLSWDLRVPFWYLSRAAEVVARQPELPVILNHCGLPWRRDAEGLAVWRAGMAALAARPNVSVKLSELGLRDRPWRRADNVPILRAVLDLFGPGRCLFASNFPVSGLRVGYRDWVEAVAEAVADCSAGERAAVFAGNARRVYRLPRPAGAAAEPD